MYGKLPPLQRVFPLRRSASDCERLPRAYDHLPYDGALFDGEKAPNLTIKPPVSNDKNYEAVEKPSTTVDVPDAYFDLDLSGSKPTDAAGNATVSMSGGGISETTVTHGGKEQLEERLCVRPTSETLLHLSEIFLLLLLSFDNAKAL